MNEDWSDFDNPPAIGGHRPRGSRGRGGRRPAPQEPDIRTGASADPEPSRRREAPRDGYREGETRRVRPLEEQVYLGHPHWRSMIGYYVRSAGAIAFLALLLYLAEAGGLVPMAAVVGLPLLVAGGLFWLGGLIRRTTVYRITTRRVSKRWGVFVKYSEEAPLRRVQNVSVGQGILDRILGIGTVDFDTAGERIGEDLLSFRGVRSPWAVRGLVPLDDGDDYL